MQPIQIGNFEYRKDEKGNWIHKAKEQQPLKIDKPQYREKPQFPVQEQIEGYSKDRFAKVVNATAIEVTNFLKNNL
jgi:hypothetical protein